MKTYVHDSWERRYKEVSFEEGGWDVNAVLIKVKREEYGSMEETYYSWGIQKKDKDSNLTWALKVELCRY